jgi:hypothetical protein
MECHAPNDAERRFCAACGERLSVRCPACTFANNPGDRFCGGCGQTLARSLESPLAHTPPHLAEKILSSRGALEGERKQVTVLFADLKGSMELLAGCDPEDARRVLDPVLARMMDAVHHYEGTVNQVMGDGIMALFGAPLAHEDHAVRACYAALRMQEFVRRHAEDVQRREGIAVQIRVGLNSGEVPRWANDPAMRAWRVWMKTYYPDGNANDGYNIYAYTAAQALVEVLRRAGDDLTRANIMRHAASLSDLRLPLLLPGITVNTSPNDFYPIEQMQLARFNGQRWVPMGEVIEVSLSRVR